MALATKTVGSRAVIEIGIDTSAFPNLANAMRAAGKNAPVALAWGLNAVGLKARTQMRRALVTQTGLKYGVITRAIRSESATAGRLQFKIVSKGGDVRVKFFNPRETPRGTVAKPWNKTTTYPRSFMKGGLFPNRVPLRMGTSGVYNRVPGAKRLPIQSTRSGLFIPEEMVDGASRAAFDKVTTVDLQLAAERALYAILSGAPVSARNFR